jgi:hypothetical protein
MPRQRLVELTCVQGDHGHVDFDRIAMQRIGLAPGLELDPAADSSLLTSGDRWRIVQATERGCETARVDRSQQLGAIARGASTDIIAHVEQAETTW